MKKKTILIYGVKILSEPKGTLRFNTEKEREQYIEGHLIGYKIRRFKAKYKEL